MSAPRPSAAREEVLSRFFGSHNDARRGEVRHLVDLYQCQGIGILPHRKGAAERWYGFAIDERQARELRGYLLAAAGPTWSAWSGPAAELDRRDPAESLLAASAEGPVYRLEPAPGRESEFRHAIDLLAALLKARPDLTALAPRPRHRVLGDLELALLAGNGAEASALIEELSASGTLGSINLLFLELRRLDAMGEHKALLDHPDLPDVLRRRRPRAVSVAVARAIQSEYVAPGAAAWVAGDRAAAAVTLAGFAELDSAFQTVLSDPVLADLPAVAAAVALHHVMRGDHSRASQVSQAASSSEHAFVEGIIQGADQSPPSTVTPSVAASPGAAPSTAAAFSAGNWTEVLALGEAHTDPVALERIIRSAYNLDTAAAAERAIELLNAASPADLALARRDRVFRDTERSLRALTAEAEPAAEPRRPASFGALFEALAENGESASALNWAERGRYEWGHDELEDSGRVRALATAIERCAATDATHSTAIGVLAHLLEWLDRAPPAETLAPVLSAAFDLVLYGSDASDSRDALSIRLLGDILRVENSPETLSQRLEEIAELWLPVAAARRVDWPLAILEVALDYGGHTASVRQFFATVVNSTVAWVDRLDAAQADAIRSIARELDEPELAALLPPPPAAGSAEDDPLARLSARTIGFYTLMPGAGTRARDSVRSRCPGVADVETNGDTVSTPALRSLANRADAMVVAHRAAQHAATDAIVAIRGRDRIIPAQGKGSVGLIRALEQWALEQPG